MKRWYFWLSILPLLFLIMGLPAFAEEMTLPQIPFPEPLDRYFEDMPQEAGDLALWLDAKTLLAFGKTAFGKAASRAVKCFLELMCVAAVCAVMKALSESVENKGILNAFHYIAILSGSVAALSAVKTVFETAAQHIQTLSVFAAGIIPVYAGLCTASGMNGLSLTAGSGLAFFVSLAALLASKVLLPLMRVCFVLGFAASVSDLQGISQIAGTVRRFFVGLVGMIAALLTSVFAFQTAIAAKADTLSGRTLRYITSSALPLVGSALSEAGRTLSGAFSLMSGVVGGVGVAAVLLLFLPMLIELWLFRLCFLSAGGVAEILGCARIASLYRDGGALFGALMAVIAIVDTALIFEFGLLMRIGT
ncbi:MAG: hypothetical protein E7616_08750 [Ruminococcaceae bacterium]|nr:hypothetical protein [Oscillospiraceae bacterium]